MQDEAAITVNGTKLTHSESRMVRLGKNMRASLEYAARTPHRWHNIGKGRGAKMAIRRLAKAGLVEMRPAFNRFRVKH